MLETNEIESHQRNRRCKEETNWKFKTKECDDWNKVWMDGLKRRMEGEEERISE